MKRLFLCFMVLILPASAFAVDINEKLSVSGTLTSVYQWLKMTKGYVDEDTEDKNKDRGSAVIDFNVSFRPIENGEFFMRASFAKGYGLEDVNPFIVSPNSDDLSHDLKKH